MFKSGIFFVVIALFASVLSQTYFPGSCPTTSVVENFDLDSYLGVWYEVRTYSVPWRASGRCTRAEYGVYPNGTVSILNTVELYGSPAQLLTSALVIGPGILAISGPSNPRDEANYFVLGTDYGNYAIGHSCRENGTHAGHFAWVLSRSRGMSEENSQIVKEILENNLVPLEPLLPVDHEDC